MFRIHRHEWWGNSEYFKKIIQWLISSFVEIGVCHVERLLAPYVPVQHVNSFGNGEFEIKFSYTQWK